MFGLHAAVTVVAAARKRVRSQDREAIVLSGGSVGGSNVWLGVAVGVVIGVM
jgi:hypothetical protein